MISQLRQPLWRRSLRLGTRTVTPRAMAATTSGRLLPTTRSSTVEASFVPSRRWLSSPKNVGEGPAPVVAGSAADNKDDDDEWTCLPSKLPQTTVNENGTTNLPKGNDTSGEEDDDDDWTCLPSKPPKFATKESRPSGSRTFSSQSAAAAEGADPQQQQPLLLLEHWQVEVQANRLQADPQQERAAKKLQKLQLALNGYDNTPWIEHYEKRAELRRRREQQQQQEEESKKKQQQSVAAVQLNEKLRNETEEQQEAPPLPPEPEPPQIRIPRGLYLYGSVGTGKSLLMDRFFDLVPVQKKRRCHFHAFMAEVHHRIHQLKLDDLDKYGRNFHVDTNEYRNPIHRVGRQIAGETSLLCFDEFQVTDVADALILSQLFSVLFTLGTVVVATSNRPPDDLYEGGVNRYYFMPFIELLKKHCVTHDMASATDYRRLTSVNFPSYYFTAHALSAGQLDALVQEVRGDTPSSSTALNLGHQRSLVLNDADERGKLVRVSFDELCNAELGATDYRRLAYQFQTVVLEDIPLLNMEKHDLARRFITLVDELYEGRCVLICVARETSATEPGLLFPKLLQGIDGEDVDSGPMLGIDQAMKGGHPVGALASVRELDFAFERAASRLTEMTSLGWWDRVLRPV